MKKKAPPPKPAAKPKAKPATKPATPAKSSKSVKPAEPVVTPLPRIVEARYCSLLVQLGANRRNLADLCRDMSALLAGTAHQAHADLLRLSLSEVETVEWNMALLAQEAFPNIRLPAVEDAWLKQYQRP